FPRIAGRRQAGPRGRSVPLGLLGALALVAAIESSLRSHELEFLNTLACDWRQGALAAGRDAPGCEVLCFGDSLMKNGVAPEVIGRRLGMRSYSLAVASGPPAASYFLLRRALESGARPKAVLIDVIPHLLAWGPESFATLWPELLDVRDGLDLARSSGDF